MLMITLYYLQIPTYCKLKYSHLQKKIIYDDDCTCTLNQSMSVVYAMIMNIRCTQLFLNEIIVIVEEYERRE